MQTVTIESVVTGWSAEDVYRRLKDSDAYVRCAPDQVKSVVTEVDGDDPDRPITHWQVYFRKGLLCWSERDHYDDATTTLSFEQIDGDFERFVGDWVVVGDGDDVVLTFTAEFDFGVPSLEAIIDPVAVRVLRQVMSQIIGKLFDGTIRS